MIRRGDICQVTGDWCQGITFLQSGFVSFNSLFYQRYYLLVTLRYSLNWSNLTLGSLSQSRRSQPQSRRIVSAEVSWSVKFACLADNHMLGALWYLLVLVWYLVGWTGWVEANSRSVSTSIGSCAGKQDDWYLDLASQIYLCNQFHQAPECWSLPHVKAGLGSQLETDLMLRYGCMWVSQCETK